MTLEDSTPTLAAAEAPFAQVSGTPLTEEELAAVMGLLAKLASSEDESSSGAGSTGPSDRTLQRRRSLGLWGRPGHDSWRHAAGLR